MQKDFFSLPNSFRFKTLRDFLGPKYKIEVKKNFTQPLNFFDTFDWRIYQAGFIFFQNGTFLSLRRINEPTLIAQTAMPQIPRFCNEITEGSLKRTLLPITGVRALLPTASASLQEEQWNILNEDDKIIVRLIFQKIFIYRKTKNQLVSFNSILCPLKGYSGEARRIEKMLNSYARKEALTDPYLQLLSMLHKKPGSYSAKLNFKFKPGMTLARALASIFRFLFKVIQQNQPGIEKDIDTEFLHDYRVAIRRTRSALTQLQEIFPMEVVKKFKKDFGYLGKRANELRDLDVYLLNEEQYRAMLPDSMKTDLRFLFEQLHVNRQKAHLKIVRDFHGDRFIRILRDWQLFLKEMKQGKNLTPLAKTPLLDFVRPIIARQMEQVLQEGRQINETSDDQLLHQLRINCKKLRYLLEFFASLFPAKEITLLIKQLKLLQDNLGDFNDLSVQQNFLKTFLNKLPAGDSNLRNTCAATGALIGKLSARQTLIRKEFAERFEQFASEENIKIADSLLS